MQSSNVLHQAVNSEYPVVFVSGDTKKSIYNESDTTIRLDCYFFLLKFTRYHAQK